MRCLLRFCSSLAEAGARKLPFRLFSSYFRDLLTQGAVYLGVSGQVAQIYERRDRLWER